MRWLRWRLLCSRPKTSSLEARSLRCSHANDLGGPDALLHGRTVAVLDALAYVSVNESSSAVAIGLTMKPLQLVVTTNDEIPSTSILEHLDSICSTLRNRSDAKLCTCSDPNSQSNADLREVSPPPDFSDENLDSHYNNLFLQIYKYSHDRLQLKNKKRWEVIDRFRNQLTRWKKEVSPVNRSDLDEPHKTFFWHSQQILFIGIVPARLFGSILSIWLENGRRRDGRIEESLASHASLCKGYSRPRSGGNIYLRSLGHEGIPGRSAA